jgi:hypothetical protein
MGRARRALHADVDSEPSLETERYMLLKQSLSLRTSSSGRVRLGDLVHNDRQ